jgi:dTDP-4-amino-4,6-dideoxygalactose transaminase
MSADPAPVPLVDLRAQHAEVADDVTAGFARVCADTSFVGGPDVAAFEAEFAAYCDTAHCVGVANGTDAIELMIRALDIGPGHEVIVPANTFVATAEAVSRAGATVVLADCDPRDLLLDPDAVAARIGGRTRAVVAVDLYGQLAPLRALQAMLNDRGIVLLEDAAQAQGARQDGTAIGGVALAAATSFYPGKNLGAYGDAGAVVTQSSAIAERVRTIAQHGALTKYDHRVVGCNSRLDTLQAVVLRAKLRRLDDWNDARREAAARYDALLSELPDVQRPATAPGNEHVWHLYVIRVPNRDAVLAHLHQAGIGAGIHYPQPLHLTGAYAHLGYPGEFPVAEQAARSILSLPLFPHITEQQQVRVVQALVEAVR